jgi:hypothetical protein
LYADDEIVWYRQPEGSSMKNTGNMVPESKQEKRFVSDMEKNSP